jgi:hypothetical protein
MVGFRLLGLLVVTVFSLFAQNPVVSGRVTDSTGAVIGGATVELTSRATAIKYQSQTNLRSA